MKTGLIVYRSKYGASRHYALELSALCKFPCLSLEGLKQEDLAGVQIIVYCAGVDAGGIAKAGQFEKMLRKSKADSRKIAVLAAGASPFDPKAAALLKKRCPLCQRENAELFYARGAWKQSEMSFADRTLCSMLAKSVKKMEPEKMEPWQQALACSVGSDHDWFDPQYLQPVLAWICAAES